MANCSCNHRSMMDIVWGCMSTIFLCTWSSVHMNIPAPNEESWKILWRRLKTMYWTLVAPELVMFFAFRQWKGANTLLKRHKEPDREWTIKHAHFLQMGGFQYRDSHRTTVLYPKQFLGLLKNGEIAFPKISAEDIADKSKANGLSKIILVAQVFWFVTQCIARLVQGVTLAQLDVTTLAIISCTFILSIIWWHKPFNVRQPVFLEKSSIENMEHKEYISQVLADEHNKASHENDHSPDNINDAETDSSMSKLLFKIPASISTDNALIVGSPVIINEVVLGLVHCIAWDSDFPSTVEKTLWRISSIFTAAVPLLNAALGSFGIMCEDLAGSVYREDRQHMCLKIGTFVALGAFVIGLTFYVVARLYLLLEAFLSLRALPPSVFETVGWTNLIPYI
ncbi:hypothetical protein BDQ17DRAFT_1237362 [Cyathus striatus]|nr:hypothetical protein BDQ17DRAFT_1237362 [Cyathus striatus]